MRIVWVWIVAITVIIPVTIGWYITLPISFGISSAIENQINVSPALGILRLLEAVTIAWGPVWDLFIVLWAFMESHRIDVTSQVYGG